MTPAPAARLPGRSSGPAPSWPAGPPPSSRSSSCPRPRRCAPTSPTWRPSPPPGAKALLLTAAADPAARTPTTCFGSSGPTSGSTRTRPPGRPSARPAPTGPPQLGPRRPRGPPALAAGRDALRAPRRRPGPHRRARHHGAHRSPVLGMHVMGSPAMGTSTEDLRALVEGHEPASPREAGRQRALPGRARPAAPRPATSTPTRPTSPRRASWSAAAARSCTSTSASASGCSPAATSTPARPRPWRPGARRPRSSGLDGRASRRRAAPDPPRRARGGARPHPSRPALPADRGRRRPEPPPGREPRRPLVQLGRGAWPWPTPRWLDALPLARAAYEAARRDRRARPPARRPGPRHVDHPAAAPARRAARDVGAGRGRGGAGRAARPSGRTQRRAGPH